MDLKSKHKVDTGFSFASMTDIVFLLLIFFMLSSTYVTPSGLPVNLPSSVSSNIILQKVSVTITSDLKYFVNDQRTTLRRLPDDLKAAMRGREGVVVLHIDQSVPTEHLVNVASIATSLKAKVSIATKPVE
ncbi:MAG TPA: biopolymer transporter ExbD [Cyclobacteriaceae bacterium]|nr:biopolymer transporter ExbD [Cyclobacteriaceae bacterium]